MRDAIEGRPGLTELEDVAAVHDWAVHSDLADPARCVVSRPSWADYLTLLALGTQPDRWAVFTDHLCRGLGINYEFYRYDAGHGSLVVAETINQTAIQAHFALRALSLRTVAR